MLRLRVLKAINLYTEKYNYLLMKKVIVVMASKRISKDAELKKLLEESENIINVSGANIIYIKKEMERIDKKSQEVERKISLLL